MPVSCIAILPKENEIPTEFHRHIHVLQYHHAEGPNKRAFGMNEERQRQIMAEALGPSCTHKTHRFSMHPHGKGLSHTDPTRRLAPVSSRHQRAAPSKTGKEQGCAPEAFQVVRTRQHKRVTPALRSCRGKTPDHNTFQSEAGGRLSTTTNPRVRWGPSIARHR